MKKLLLVLLALVLVLSSGCAKSDPQRPQLTDEEWGFVFEQTEKANVSPESDMIESNSVSLVGEGDAEFIFICEIRESFDWIYERVMSGEPLSQNIMDAILKSEDIANQIFICYLKSINICADAVSENPLAKSEDEDFMTGIMDYYDARYLVCPYNPSGLNPVFELKWDHETKDITTEYTILSGEEWIE